MNTREFLIALFSGLCDLYTVMIFIRVIATWLRYDVQMRFAGIINFTAKAVDPAMIFIRRIFPFNVGAFDFSPVLLVLCVMLVKRGLIWVIFNYVK